MSKAKQTSNNQQTGNSSLGVVMCWAVTEDYQPVDYGEMYTTIIAVFSDKKTADEYRNNLELNDKHKRISDYEVIEIPFNPPCT